MYCRKCGKVLHDDDTFCVYCGASVRRDEQQLTAETYEPDEQTVTEVLMTPDNGANSFDGEPLPETAGEQAVHELAPPPETPEKPKNKKLLIGIVAGAAVLIAAILLAVLLIPKAPKEYFLNRFISDGKDYLAEMCQSSMEIPNKLQITGEGEAAILFPDGETFITISYDEKTMTGTCAGAHYEDNSYEVSVSISDERFIVKSESSDLDFEIVCDAVDSQRIKKLSGSYAITDMNIGGENTDSCFEYYTMDKQVFISTFQIDADGSCYTESYAGTKTLEVTLNTEDMTISGTANDDKGNSGAVKGYLAAYDDTVVLYNTTGHCAFYFVRSDTVDHAKFKGEYILTEDKSPESDNMLEHRVKERLVPKTKLSINADGTGKLLYADGSVFADLTLNKGETAGEMSVLKTQDKIPFFLRHQKDRVVVYYGAYEVFVFEPARDKLTPEELGKYTVTRMVNAAEDTDTMEEWVINNKMITNRFTLKSDNTGTILTTNDSEFAVLTLDPAEMLCTFKLSNTDDEGHFFMVFGSEELTLYGTDNSFIINLSKNAYESVSRLIGSGDSAKGTLISYKSKDKKENQASKMTDSYLELKEAKTYSILHDNGKEKWLNYDAETMIGKMDSGEVTAEKETTEEPKTDTSKSSSRLIELAKRLAKANSRKVRQEIFMTVYDDVVSVHNTEAGIVYKYRFDPAETKE